MDNTNRITYLDGHRGLAIILVAMFHAYTRWPDLVPYGSEYANFPLFQYGYFGVQLFFLISGFVILMTLDKCSSLKTFIYKRWLRLFPAMLVCSLFIFTTTSFFYERPYGQPNTLDLIPGLTFVEPYIWEKVTGLSFRSIEGAFWSLYVEFKFYIFSAFVYFLFGRVFLIIALALAFFSFVFIDIVNQSIDSRYAYLAYILVDHLDFRYFGWFASGCSYYLFYKTNKLFWFLIGMAMSVFSSFVSAGSETIELIFILVITLVFGFSVISQVAQKILSNKLLVFFGFVSYPLYLIHENMMISLIIKLNEFVPIIPGYALPIVSIAFVLVVAYVVAKYLESPVKHSIDNLKKQLWSYMGNMKKIRA